MVLRKSALLAAVMVVSVVVGFLAGSRYEHAATVSKYISGINPIRQSDLHYNFIHPLLAYNVPSANDQSKFHALDNVISKLVQQKKQNGELTSFSLFLSELDKGKWMGINEYQKYTPASLLKVALMMAYYKKSEQSSGDILNKNLVYTTAIKDLTFQTVYDTGTKLEVGKSYNVDDLINRMIVDSDNGAKTLLLFSIDPALVEGVFKGLGVESPIDSELYVISPLNYSLFFRVLYSATYLNRELSEKALQTLSHTRFVDGLVAGIPKDVMVSHKFGENVIVDSGSRIKGYELHDCGIVYYKPSPYFACIMTQGPDKEKLQTYIKDISALIYEDITKE